MFLGPVRNESAYNQPLPPSEENYGTNPPSINQYYNSPQPSRPKDYGSSPPSNIDYSLSPPSYENFRLSPLNNQECSSIYQRSNKMPLCLHVTILLNAEPIWFFFIMQLLIGPWKVYNHFGRGFHHPPKKKNIPFRNILYLFF